MHVYQLNVSLCKIREVETKVSLSEPSVNQALDLRSIQLFWIAWQLLSTYDSSNWMGSFHSLIWAKYGTAGHLVILKPWPAAGHLAI